MQDIADLLSKAIETINCTQNIQDLDALRVQYLGKKGSFTNILKQLKDLSADERPKAGQIINEAKCKLVDVIQQQKISLENIKLKEQLSKEKIDITMPGRGMDVGNLHPVTKTIARIEDFFTQLGFDLIYGPEVEDEYHNFEALNIAQHHPARDMHDTFYFGDGSLLRTHTSPVQIRAMKNDTPPFKLISIGRVYRCDSDITHTPMFHQVECLMVDKGITFANLKGILTEFLQVFFEQELAVRFRPSYFPFTEPSAEVDMECTNCKGSGCRICSNTGWLEILGCGMVHPAVLQNCNIDPEEYTGFAFGIGVDRLAMLRYGINDLRLNFESDIRFLEQF